MADIFISYKRERRPAARHLEQILTRYGYSVWFDLALIRGADYEDQIQRELNTAAAVIVLWCGLSVRSAGVRSEASRAKTQGKLIPVVIEPCELPMFSTLEQNIDLSAASGSPRDHALDPVLDDVERLVGREPAINLRALRDYEATWRTMTGGLSLARLPLEEVPVPDDAERGASGDQVETGSEFSAWKAEWEAASSGTDLVRLRAIAEFGHPYFAALARARIAEVEAELKRLAEEQEREARARQQAEQRLAQYRAEGRIEVAAQRYHPEGNEAVRAGLLKPGAGKSERFQDLDIGPEMVVVPGGDGIAPFAIGRFTLTFAEWDNAQKHPQWQEHSGIAPRQPEDRGWGRGRQPVINVSWEDAQAYSRWLSHVTDKTYRLPSEAEWEHACRAGSKTKYWWGDNISAKQANFGQNRNRTVSVDSFEPNPWGLYQVHGNVWEWCEDAYDASSRVLRGGSWGYDPDNLRSSGRGRYRPVYRSGSLGFRLARTL